MTNTHRYEDSKQEAETAGIFQKVTTQLHAHNFTMNTHIKDE